MNEALSAKEALSETLSGRSALIDVRSEGEFELSGIPAWSNIPILSNEHRHEVGVRYAREGQQSAVELGHRLVDPIRDELLAGWGSLVERSPERRGVVTCWRGGLRSGIAAGWMREAGHEVQTVEGGYKAMRRELIGALEGCPPVIVLSGMTGSGKTELIARLGTLGIDLEGLAAHRGSSFGAFLGARQPAQSAFENALALEILRRKGASRVVIEDENRHIGKREIPNAVFERMRDAPVVLLEEPVERRIHRVVEEYVNAPLRGGIPRESVKGFFLDGVRMLKKQLGGRRASGLARSIEQAFGGAQGHETWVGVLLEDHYDFLYERSLRRSGRKVLFRGGHRECMEFLRAEAGR